MKWSTYGSRTHLTLFNLSFSFILSIDFVKPLKIICPMELSFATSHKKSSPLFSSIIFINFHIHNLKQLSFYHHLFLHILALLFLFLSINEVHHQILKSWSKLKRYIHLKNDHKKIVIIKINRHLTFKKFKNRITY